MEHHSEVNKQYGIEQRSCKWG